MNKRQKYEKLKNEYGKDPRDLSNIKESRDMLRLVKIYHDIKKDDTPGSIDSITWNDLEMDEIYHLVNHTRSYAGEQFLYHLLHMPQSETRAELDKGAEFFEEHEKERIDTEIGLMSLGKGYLDYYLSETISDIDCLNMKHKLLYPTLCVLLFGSIALAIVNHMFIGLSIIIAVINLVVYMVVKLRYENEIYSLGSIVGLVRFVDHIIRYDGLSELYSDKGMEDSLKDVKKATSFLEYLRFTRQLGKSGEPLGVVAEYLAGVTMIDSICCSIAAKRLIKYQNEIMQLFEFAGWLDAAIAVASFRKCIPTCKPDIDGSKYIRCDGLYHPLIKDAVKNDFHMKRNSFFTGANATGKSTFMKAVAINVILGETISTCTAEAMAFPDMYVMTSMALRDDILSGESYYVREIKYLKRMIEKVTSGVKTLIVIDEILKGTNTKERIQASKAVLEYLQDTEAVVITATHDMELVDLMKDTYDAYYFDCLVEDGQINFNYVLHEGRNETTNAITLMSVMGFPKEIIDKANIGGY